VESAKSAFKEVVGQVFPKETGKALEAMYLSPETAAQCVEAAEDAQKNGRKPVIYTGKVVAPAPQRGAPIAVRNDEVEGKTDILGRPWEFVVCSVVGSRSIA